MSRTAVFWPMIAHVVLVYAVYAWCPAAGWGR
jgi:hypothetical protein